MDWEIDTETKYTWKHQEKLVEMMSFTNDLNPELKCVYVRFLHNGDWLSNYFITREKMDAKEFAIEMIERYQKET